MSIALLVGGGGSGSAVPTFLFTTSAPASPTAETYSWRRLGNGQILVRFRLHYGTAGSGVTGAQLAWPSDLPLPKAITGQVANTLSYAGGGNTNSSSTRSAGGTCRGGIWLNAAGTGYELEWQWGSASSRFLNLFVIYEEA